MQGLAFGARQLGQFLGLAQHADGLVGHLFAKCGKANHAPGSLDEHHAEQGLKLAQARGQRRLGDKAGLGSAAEMTMRATVAFVPLLFLALSAVAMLFNPIGGKHTPGRPGRALA